MTDKATPASVDSVYALLNPCCLTYAKWKELGKRRRTEDEEVAALREMREAQEAFRSEVERLAERDAPTDLDLDTLRADFHKWCATNGYKTEFLEGGECPMGGPVYVDQTTHAAWWAFQKAVKLYAARPRSPYAAAQSAPFNEALQALVYASKVYRVHGISTYGIDATIARLKSQQPSQAPAVQVGESPPLPSVPTKQINSAHFLGK
jgi:hypothetical protein